jgi:hypothetical protein
MTDRLTIAYITNRREPQWQWFFESLARQSAEHTSLALDVVVVDFHRDTPGRAEEVATLCRIPGVERIVHVAPKPCVWQGPHRLTQRDYFAASNTRNTALCHARDGWLAYVDDLSVLLPGWLGCVSEAMQANHVRLGAYRKVRKLVVQHGTPISWEDYPGGLDSRWHHGSDAGPVPAAGSWLFGCSLVAPVEAFLSINGWDEDNDSMGFEDYACGMMMQAHGYPFVYDRRMLTFEDEDLHHVDPPLLRLDKGVSPDDASHKMLGWVMHGRNTAPNYFGDGGIRGLRQAVLAGEPFPIPTTPEHDWRDGQPLREM